MSDTRREIYCCGCNVKIKAVLTDGFEIYNHRPDLHELPFWKCGNCGNFVGCHYKTKNRFEPLGCIATPEIKIARRHIHALIDSIWKSGKMKRSKLYAIISKRTGWNYHTAEIRSIEEARKVYKIAREYV
jgi:hypothetical protein